MVQLSRLKRPSLSSVERRMNRRDTTVVSLIHPQGMCACSCSLGQFPHQFSSDMVNRCPVGCCSSDLCCFQLSVSIEGLPMPDSNSGLIPPQEAAGQALYKEAQFAF